MTDLVFTRSLGNRCTIASTTGMIRPREFFTWCQFCGFEGTRVQNRMYARRLTIRHCATARHARNLKEYEKFVSDYYNERYRTSGLGDKWPLYAMEAVRNEMRLARRVG